MTPSWAPGQVRGRCRLAASLGVAKVALVIRSEATEFRYERGRQPLPKIGPWRAEIDALAGEQSKLYASG
jgi:hypothetical protein